MLDEPSIGLHPSNIEGLTGVMHDLIADGNSVVLVDHDVQILKESDWMIEMGPEAGAGGGTVIAEGTIGEIEESGKSVLDRSYPEKRIPARESGRIGRICLSMEKSISPPEISTR